MNKKGFTLVELLAVIAILAILVIIALPNVLSMFNSAKKDIFLTEAKNVYKEVSKKYISETMKGNKVNKISSDGIKLDLESSNLTYNISLDDKGNIKKFQVSDGTYCLSGSFSNLSELTSDKIKEGECTTLVVKSFSEDDWSTIIEAVQTGETDKYKVGDTKTIDMGTYGTHTVRIANMSSPSECSNSNYSKSACGFVIEFADVVYNENISVTECGGNDRWINTELRTYLNGSFYNLLPSDLRSGIIDTNVISGHGRSDGSNYTTTDKIYLFSSGEVWGGGSSSNMNNNLSKLSSTYRNNEYRIEKMVMCSPEAADVISPILGSSDLNVTRQLDYYKSKNVSITNAVNAIKKYDDLNSKWWLRTPLNTSNTFFYYVSENGTYGANHNFNEFGISPAFRIG